jgi:hypothetical protein
MLRHLVPAILLGAALCSATASADNNLRVPQEYPTIQSAIDAAPQGATVVVAPGTYRENLLIGKPLTLRSARGPRHTVLDGGGVGPVVVALGTGAERIEIDGFTITNGFNNFTLSADYRGNAAGIHMDSVVGVVTDNLILGNAGCLGNGISTRFASVTIQRNQIRDNAQHPSCDGADGGGIFLLGNGVQPSVVAQNIVAGHFINGRGAGIAIQGMTGLTIRDNIIHRNEANSQGGGIGGGIFLNLASATISGNVLVGNSAEFGGALVLFALSNAPQAIVHGNVMENNRAQTGSAMALSDPDGSLRLFGNVINGNTQAELIDCSGPVTVPASNVLHNGRGPVLGTSCVSP